MSLCQRSELARVSSETEPRLELGGLQRLVDGWLGDSEARPSLTTTATAARYVSAAHAARGQLLYSASGHLIMYVLAHRNS
eukprot:6202692-Pleurochrysis_carterae.AAC.4